MSSVQICESQRPYERSSDVAAATRGCREILATTSNPQHVPMSLRARASVLDKCHIEAVISS